MKTEEAWLPKFTELTLNVPRVLATGASTASYPSIWSIYDWFEGESIADAPLANLDLAAMDLAQFIREIRAIDTSGTPLAGPDNHYRGVDLALRDRPTRDAIAGLSDLYSSAELGLIWDEAGPFPSRSSPSYIIARPTAILPRCRGGS